MTHTKRSRSPSPSTSANAAERALAPTEIPEAAVVSSKVPSPRLSEQPGRAERVGDEEVGVSVAVHVAGGDSGRGDPLAVAAGEPGGVRHVGEAAVPVVAVEDRAHAVGDEEVLEAVAVVVEDRGAGARPDVGDQAVGLAKRRIRPRGRRGPASEVASRKRGAALERSSIGRSKETVTVDGDRDRLGRLGGRLDVGRRIAGRVPLRGDEGIRGPLDPRAVGAKAAHGEADAAARDFARAGDVVLRLFDAVGDPRDAVEAGPGPVAQARDARGVGGEGVAAEKRAARQLGGVALALEAVHPRDEVAAKAGDARSFGRARCRRRRGEG